MEPLLDFPSEDEFSGDDNPHPLDQNEQPLNPNEQRPQAPKRIRLTPAGFRVDTFFNEVKKDKEIPEKCCAVCCRLLYPEEYCKLSVPYVRKIEKMLVKDRQAAHRNNRDFENINWPLGNYRDHHGNKIQNPHTHKPKGKGAEYVIVCARHKSSGTQSVETIMKY
ncbi:hypothetical protein BG015_006534, partial [Linnemannia schmuckeri]